MRHLIGEKSLSSKLLQPNGDSMNLKAFGGAIPLLHTVGQLMRDQVSSGMRGFKTCGDFGRAEQPL